MKRHAITTLAVAFALLAVTRGQDARQILSTTGVRGGLVVHLGCGDGRLTAALRSSDAYLVHGLDVKSEKVAAAREYVRSLSLYGKVAIDRLTRQELPEGDDVRSRCLFARIQLSPWLWGLFVGRGFAPRGRAHRGRAHKNRQKKDDDCPCTRQSRL